MGADSVYRERHEMSYHVIYTINGKTFSEDWHAANIAEVEDRLRALGASYWEIGLSDYTILAGISYQRVKAYCTGTPEAACSASTQADKSAGER
jgi:hypothetical protein